MAAQVKSAKQLEPTPLVREFLAQHQKMSKLLLRTVVCLEGGEIETAMASAHALDKVGGPHIAYEESELYPRISGEQLVSATTRAMYIEHRQAGTALKTLLDNPQPDDATKQEIIAGLRTGVHHTELCGSLASLLAALPEPEQAESLAKLLAYREQGRKWTDRIR